MEQSIGKANSGRFWENKMGVSITWRALWWAIKAHRGQQWPHYSGVETDDRGQQWPEAHFTRSQVERGRVPYGTIIVFG